MSETKISFNNLDTCNAYAKLKKYRRGEADSLKSLLTAARVQNSVTPAGAGLRYYYAAKAVDAEIINTLQELADEQQLVAKYKMLLDGAVMNTGEKRMVLHQLTRGQQGAAVTHEGKDLHKFSSEQQQRIFAFAEIEVVVQAARVGRRLPPRRVLADQHGAKHEPSWGSHQ